MPIGRIRQRGSAADYRPGCKVMGLSWNKYRTNMPVLVTYEAQRSMSSHFWTRTQSFPGRGKLIPIAQQESSIQDLLATYRGARFALFWSPSL